MTEPSAETAGPPGRASGRAPRSGRAFAVYTGLRILLVVAVWFAIELVTPLRGVLSIAVAILVSGAISLVVLRQPREELGQGVAGFFSRMNARIDASTTAEDAWDDERRAREARASQAEQGAEEQAVGEEQGARPLEHGDERRPDGA